MGAHRGGTRTDARTGKDPERAPALEKSKASCGTGGMSMQKASERGDLK